MGASCRHCQYMMQHGAKPIYLVKELQMDVTERLALGHGRVKPLPQDREHESKRADVSSTWMISSSSRASVSYKTLTMLTNAGRECSHLTHASSSDCSASV